MSVQTHRVRRLDISLPGALAYWNRNAAVFRRTWLFGMIAWFLEPVLYLLAMGLGLGQYLEDVRGVRYLDFIAPGLLAVSAQFGATFESTWNVFTKMERYGVYEAARATPLTLHDVAIGEMLWATTRATIHGTAFLLVAGAFGVFDSIWILAALPVLPLIGAVFAIVGLMYTYLATRIDYIAYYWTMFITPVFLFSGVFFPLDRLPGWVDVVAWFSPLFHGANAMRSLAAGNPAGALGPALWLIGAIAVLAWIPPKLLRRRLIA